MSPDQTAIALDVGGRRIGVAIANMSAKLPSPLTTIENDSDVWDRLRQLVEKESTCVIVVGLPTGMDGRETAQTLVSRQFAESLQAKVSVPVYLQDEAVTSVLARNELQSRGKTFDKGDIDALAATMILDDYLKTVVQK